jgi:hypothetical protein
MDDVMLRRYLVVRIKDAGKLGLFKSEGGKHEYGPSWAQRFSARWGIVTRVTTFKMREVPADYKIKKSR